MSSDTFIIYLGCCIATIYPDTHINAIIFFVWHRHSHQIEFLFCDLFCRANVTTHTRPPRRRREIHATILHTHTRKFNLPLGWMKSIVIVKYKVLVTKSTIQKYKHKHCKNTFYRNASEHRGKKIKTNLKKLFPFKHQNPSTPFLFLPPPPPPPGILWNNISKLNVKALYSQTLMNSYILRSNISELNSIYSWTTCVPIGSK